MNSKGIIERIQDCTTITALDNLHAEILTYKGANPKTLRRFKRKANAKAKLLEA
jgi:hypothetical protein